MENPSRRRTSDRARALLKYHEQGPGGGFARTPYICPAGHRTIGWGHVIQRHETFVEIDEARAERLLETDLAPCELVVSSLNADLAQHEFDAVVLLIFNIGIRNFDTSTLKVMLRARNRVGASSQFGRWVYITDPVSRRKVRADGLVIRRTVEQLLFDGAGDRAIVAERTRLEALARGASL